MCQKLHYESEANYNSDCMKLTKSYLARQISRWAFTYKILQKYCLQRILHLTVSKLVWLIIHVFIPIIV